MIPMEVCHDGGPYHIDPSSLICFANQWAGFYMIVTTVMKELTQFLPMLPLTSKYPRKRERFAKMNNKAHYGEIVFYFSAYCSTVSFYQDVPFHRRYLIFKTNSSAPRRALQLGFEKHLCMIIPRIMANQMQRNLIILVIISSIQLNNKKIQTFNENSNIQLPFYKTPCVSFDQKFLIDVLKKIVQKLLLHLLLLRSPMRNVHQKQIKQLMRKIPIWI